MTERPHRRSRYDRPRRYVSWSALVIGILIGIAGGVYFTWNVAPTEEVDTEPWQLNRTDKAHYMVAIALAYNYDGDLGRVVENLEYLNPSGDNWFRYVAEIACDLARTGYVNSSSGLNAIRAMMKLYQLQGQSGCADTLIPAVVEPAATETIIIASTPTLQPPPSKTPTLEVAVQFTPTQSSVLVPTPPIQSTFRIVLIEPFCDVDFPGVIEVRVQDFNAAAIPGQPIRVRWDDGESIFYNGLKPERGLDYADFQMETGKGYIIDMPGLADPSTSQIVASPCTTLDGRDSIQSYRVVLRPSFE